MSGEIIFNQSALSCHPFELDNESSPNGEKGGFFNKKHRNHLIVIGVLLILSAASIAYIAVPLVQEFVFKKSGALTIVSTPHNVTFCSDDVLRTAPLDGSSIQVWWEEPSVIRPTGEDIAYLSNRKPGDSFEIGNTTVTYNIWGGPSFCEFVVSVFDITPPSIRSCPKCLTYNLSTERVAWVEPEATDNSGKVSLVSQSHKPGDVFPVGGTSVEYVYSDPSGNVNLCSFVVKVIDITPPQITNCPNDVTQNLSTEVGTKVTWVEPEATDNSGEVSLVSQSHKPGDVFHVGGTSVEYVYRDPSGNVNLCSFVVRVFDITPPRITNCPNNAAHNLSTELGTKVTWVEPQATDNSGKVSLVSQSHKSGNVFPVGGTSVEYVYSDPSGNVKLCNFIIGVVDVNPPVIYQCPEDIPFYVASSKNKSVVWVEPKATDNSGQVSLVSQTHRPGEYFPVGSTAVQYVFKDPMENINVCSFFIKGKLSSTPTACGGASSRTHLSNFGTTIISVLVTIFASKIIFWNVL